MCGIIGYNGTKDATTFIGQGLKNLEYRGYDSYGSGFVDPTGKLFVHKSIGYVLEKYDKFLQDKVQSKCGIGHVRWATTGKILVKNSHPHYGGNKNLILVHNGIVLNYKKLKTILIRKGYKFHSNTDTEVLAHWIYHTNNFKNIEGDFACLFLCKNKQLIYAIKRNIPLFLASINDDNILSSSLNVFDDLATEYEYFELENDKLYEIGKSKINHKYIKVKNITPQSKANSKNITLKEIKEQINTFENIENSIKLNKNRKLVIFGCGSSYNAALVSKYFFYKQGFQNVEILLPSEIEQIDLKTQYLAISQSGETKDVLDVARRLNKRLYAVTNNRNNTLEQIAKTTVYLTCGREIGVAATKSFTNTLSILYQIAGFKIKNNKTIYKIFSTHYPKVPKKFKRFNNIFIFGRGVLHYVACEGALKLKEMANVHAEAINAAEMKHGPITLINKNSLSIFLGNNMEESVSQVRARDGKVMLLAAENSNLNIEKVNLIKMPETSNYLEDLVVKSIYLQIIAFELGKMRGINIDRPINLAKCITV